LTVPKRKKESRLSARENRNRPSVKEIYTPNVSFLEREKGGAPALLLIKSVWGRRKGKGRKKTGAGK